MAAPEKSRFLQLDALRGIAALLVVFNHTAQTSVQQLLDGSAGLLW